MTITMISGTEGYAEEAATLLCQYESIAFEDVHAKVTHLFPTAPSDVLDVGAGTGRDAAGFAALGHRVVAVEPTQALRAGAMRLHPSLRIAWLNDSLPELSRVRAMRRHFDLVMLTAVWMHLDPKQRARAMPHVAALVRPGGVMILSLRHGPVPQGRRMFDVSATETERLAAADGLVLILRYDFLDGALRRPGISWSRLAFRKPCTG